HAERAGERAARPSGVAGELADADRLQRQQPERSRPRPDEAARRRAFSEPAGRGDAGFWSDADWIACRDGKARPVEPGTFPLAHGTAARVGRLRAYGNAIVAEAAKIFIQSVMDIL